MKFRNTIEVLHNQVNELSGLMVYLEKNDQIRNIEIDLLLEKLRDVYDVAMDLQSAVYTDNQNISSEADRTEVLSVPDPEQEVEKTDEEPNTIVFEVEAEDSKEESIPESVMDKDSEINGESQKDEQELVSDKYKSPRTLNEEISGEAAEDQVTAQIKKQPINSIHSAIGLNEKFELISELFDGNKAQFEESLEVLNQAETFVEAYGYLESTFNWDMDSPHVQRILELIRRKLIVRRND